MTNMNTAIAPIDKSEHNYMEMKHTDHFFALVLMSWLALTGAALFGIGEKRCGSDTRHVSRGTATPLYDDEFLARYYSQGASAGSSWENLTGRDLDR